MKEFVDNLVNQEQVVVFALLFVATAFVSIQSLRDWRKFGDKRSLSVAISVAVAAVGALVMVIHLASGG